MKLFHWHHWLTIAVQGGQEGSRDVTVLLQRCDECGDVQTKIVDGYWNLDEVTGR